MAPQKKPPPSVIAATRAAGLERCPGSLPILTFSKCYRSEHRRSCAAAGDRNLLLGVATIGPPAAPQPWREPARPPQASPPALSCRAPESGWSIWRTGQTTGRLKTGSRLQCAAPFSRHKVSVLPRDHAGAERWDTEVEFCLQRHHRGGIEVGGIPWIELDTVVPAFPRQREGLRDGSPPQERRELGGARRCRQCESYE